MAGAATTAASTSSLSTVSKDVKNKFGKHKPRQLSRRVSDESLERKDFTQEMEAAALDMGASLSPRGLRRVRR